MFIRLIFFLACLCSLAGTAEGQAVYWNYGIASAEVGYSEQRNLPIGRKVSFVGIGPTGASQRLADCIASATIAAAEATWDPLDNRILDAPAVAARLARSGAQFDAAALHAAQRAEVQKTAEMVARSEALFKRKVANCAGADAVPSTALAVVSRLCVSWSEEPCRFRRAVGRTADRRTTRYAKIYDWLISSGTAAPINQIVQLVAAGGQPKNIDPDLRDRAYLAAPSTLEAQRQFEQGAARLRARGGRYEYIVPRAVAIDGAVALRLLDTIDHPAFILGTLTNGGLKLVSIQDEIARSRIRECALFLGQRSASAAARCAGYNLTDADLKACLGGESCMPDFGDTARLTAVLLQEPVPSLASLAKAATMPRILGGGTMADFAAEARRCAGAGTSVEANTCLLKTQLSGRDLATLECVASANYRPAPACIGGALPDTREARLAACLLQKPNDQARFLCVAAESSPEAARALACYEQNNRSPRAAAACLAAPDLPPEAREGLACTAHFADDYKRIAGCMAAARIGGDLGTFAGCAAASGGDFIGAVACTAGGSLTSEQQILLQCASQSPDPASFALCTGGQLTMREFAKCRDRDFGEGECFGENNSLRLFSRRLGLGDIHRDTVVGQIGAAHLDLAKFQVRVAESLLADTSRLLDDAGGEAEQFVGAVTEAVQRTVQAAAEEVQRVGCSMFGVNCPEGEHPWWEFRAVRAPALGGLGPIGGQGGLGARRIDPGRLQPRLRLPDLTGRRASDPFWAPPRALRNARPEDRSRVAPIILLPAID